MNLTALEAAYLAGLFDGNGGVYISKSRPFGRDTYRLDVRISARSNDVLCAFRAKLAGVGSIYERKRCWTWSLTNREAARLLLAIDPYCQVRNAEITAGIDFSETYFREQHKLGPKHIAIREHAMARLMSARGRACSNGRLSQS